jgi:hypothetical protein
MESSYTTWYDEEGEGTYPVSLLGPEPSFLLVFTVAGLVVAGGLGLVAVEALVVGTLDFVAVAGTLGFFGLMLEGWLIRRGPGKGRQNSQG